MAKIGTVQVEVKPVLVEASLDELASRIEEVVKKAVSAGVAAGLREKGDDDARS